VDDDREPDEAAQPQPRNPVPEDMPTDPPLVPRPFADGVLAEEE